MKVCPYCSAHVLPHRDPQGHLACPQCHNLGPPSLKHAPQGVPPGWPPMTPAPWNSGYAWPPQKTCDLAVVSLATAGGSLLLPMFTLSVLGTLGGIVAVALGAAAQSKIRQSQGALKGRGLATAGIAVGAFVAAIYGLRLLLYGFQWR